MEQFNKVLAALLILVVAVGISLFVFSQLGILSRMFPARTSGVPQSTVKGAPSPTATSPVTPTPQTQPSILGWLSQLVKAKNTPTQAPLPTTATLPTVTQQQELPVSIIPTPAFEKDNVTIVPYGSVSSPTYPSSGVETITIPLLATCLLFGVCLHRLS